MRTLFAILAMLSTLNVLAADRASLVQSKIQNSLNQILPSTDYLVIVNRLDQLEDGGQSDVVSGALKSLPGLTVGVDAKGQIVRQDAGASDYNGGLSISVILDSRVNAETQKLIEKIIPEVSGGLRDTDEFKMSKSILRQPPVPVAAMPGQQSSPSPAQQSSNSWMENIRFLALLLFASGIFAWMLGRIWDKKEEKNPGQRPNANDKAAVTEDELVFKTDLTELSPKVVGLYLLREIKEKREALVESFFHATSASFQRKVFLTYPAWVSASLQSYQKTNDEIVADEINPEFFQKIYLDVTVLEQSLMTELDFEKAFLMWFPPKSLRMVPKSLQNSFSQKSRNCLWYFRPELGEFVKASEMTTEEMQSEPNFDQIHSCFSEMSAWTSSAYISGERMKTNPVDTWAQILNSLSEFGPLQSQLAQAKDKLSPEDYLSLEGKIVTLRTPLLWSELQVRQWLRLLDPQDYLWWVHMLGEPTNWNLDAWLTPMRRSMYKFSEENPAFGSWTEENKKLSSSRILESMKAVHLGENQQHDLEAA
jgi:hypothetical protein